MIIDGKKIAGDIYEKLKEKVKKLDKKPTLGAILVGNNAASLKYIEQKRKWAQYIGIDFKLVELDVNIEENKLIETIREFNESNDISGFIIQLPLPKHINTNKILRVISHKKDVDGFNPVNVGKVLTGDKTGFVPCTPAGVMKLLEAEKINVAGKIVTVIGKSNIVGKPMVSLLMNAGATVTSCNSQTTHLSKHTTMADIVICAVGKPGILKVNMVKIGTTVIDVGFTVIDGKILGDADFHNIDIVGNKITPVPGGVGPLTVAMLLENTYKAHSYIK